MPFTDETRARAREIIARYPDGPRSALLPLLHLVQADEGHVSQAGIAFCAEQLGITKAQVSAVATFYTMYKRRPAGGGGGGRRGWPAPGGPRAGRPPRCRGPRLRPGDADRPQGGAEVTGPVNKLTPVLTKRWLSPDAWKLATYERLDGYAALRKA